MPPAIARDLLEYIDKSPTPFHASRNLVAMFSDAGFTLLDETEDWHCQAGQKYVVTRNDSSVIAFNLGTEDQGSEISRGMRMIGAHTDSPCLKIKPNPEFTKHGFLQLGVEVYGGALLHPWLDRDLSIAGRISGISKRGKLFSQLIDFQAPVAVIPNLAIHLDRTANENKTINPQTELPLIIGQDKAQGFKDLLLDYCEENVDRVLDFELFCYDTQPSGFVGLEKDFVCAARLDNLLSTYVGARALIDAEPARSSLLIATDHEEVGSASACGAHGPFLRAVLERITGGEQHTGNPERLTRIIARSTLLSCDNAHGVHPNYADKHDNNHGPVLNQGPVIKVNANQRYASNSVGSARFQQVCEKAGVPIQHFVTRSDLGCGSTIGPITASELGIETLDIGAPQWAMHSIRETAGSRDIEYLYIALKAYLS
ncbi:MAG: M18 family aminopeptidase [Gammaproteobacteria bacterium]|nr:M18 family aminopeptidase [Gammaproteobacteria bacterium]